MTASALADNNHGIDLDEVYAFTVQLAEDAGRMLLGAAETRMRPMNDSNLDPAAGHVVEKESSVDLVTQTDEGVYAVLF